MTKLYFLAFAFSVSAQLCFGQVPTISSFAPTAGPAGSNVVITGTNFNTIANNNTVYFGAVKANIVSATANTITAVVPAGATYQPITVKTDSLTAFSSKPFVVTFGGGTGADFTNTSLLQPPLKLADANLPCFGDFDGDGLADMAASTSGNKVSIFKNQSTAAEFAFTLAASYTPNYLPSAIITADFTGDGKLDIAVGFGSLSGVYLYKNTSSIGNISFDTPFYYNLGGTGNVYSLAATDIDSDGKTDLLVGYVSSGTAVSIVRNTGILGNLGFAAKTNLAFGTVPGGSGNVGADNKIVLADMDGDNKPDVTSVSRFFPPFLIYRNTSTPGTISFAAKVSITSNRNTTIGNGNFDMKIADIDGDGRPDIHYVSSDSAYLCIYKNTSSIANITFESKAKTDGIYYPKAMDIADVDGDGMPDPVVLTSDSAIVFKNTSTIGNIAFNPRKTYKAAYALQNINLADADADGKTDIVLSGTDVNNSFANSTFVLRNLVNGPYIRLVLPITASTGTPVTITGERFTNATGVNFGGADAASFTVLSDTVIMAIVGNGTSGKVAVTTAGGIAKYDDFTFSPPIPVIDSFSPTSGPVGIPVVIRGKNFSNNLAGNIVYFGTGRAVVTDANDTAITVSAPTGNSYQPISVTIAGSRLTAYSRFPFTTTFFSNVSSFSNANFGDTATFALFGTPLKITAADFDNDNKPDIASSVYINATRVSVFKNVGLNGNMQFQPRREYEVIAGAAGLTKAISTDVDGDAKPDMIAVSDAGDFLAIFKNTTTADSISFAAKAIFGTGIDPTTVTAADLDNDGKPDFAVTNSTAGTLSVFKNISSSNAVLCKPKQDFNSGSGGAPQAILLEDFDNDGRRDMAAINYNHSNLVLFANTSTVGTISFADKTSKPTGTGPIYLTAADLDGDGKLEIMVANSTSKSISVFRNISIAGSILFDDKVDFPMPDFPRGITVTDLNGDGKPDIASGNNSFPGTISLFKNNSTPGNIVLAARVDISKTNNVSDIFAADINGDGKPDLMMSNNSKSVTVMRNIIGDPVATITCPFADSVVLNAGITGSSYQWQKDDGTGFVNITNDANTSGSSTSRLVVKNVPSSRYGYQYRCIVDGRNSDVYVLKPTARWLGTINNVWENTANWACGQLPDSNTDVLINSGTVIINSNATVRSLKIKPGASVRINTGFGLTVLW